MRNFRAILALATVGLFAIPLFADDKPATPIPPAPAAAVAEPAKEPVTAPATAPVIAPAKEPAKEAAKEPEKKPAAAAPLQLKAGDANIKFGLLLQPQADIQENAAGAYAQNLIVRRTRFLIGGQFSKQIHFFFETEASRLGNSPASGTGTKTISTGFQTLDAVVEYRPRKTFNLAAGLLRVPTSRDALESASNEFTLDFNTYAFTGSGAMGSTGGNRDTGLQARGWFFDDRLEYRGAVVAGLRDQHHVTHPLRYVGRLQWNFFDKEVYNMPSYVGSNFGNKKILAVGAAYDMQMDYDGFSVDVFTDNPTSFGSWLGTATFQQLDGGRTQPTSLARSNVVTVDGGLYFKQAKIGTWARFEQRDFSIANNRDEHRYLVGVNYYPLGNNFNFKLGVGRYTPTVGRETTQFTLQMQVFYF